MRKVTLGRTGLEVSAVGFGGIPIQRVSEAKAAEVIHRALDLGVTFIDTAAGYSDSQRKIGAALEGRSEGIILASKSGAAKKDAIIADIERACAEMRVEHIHIYQLHGVSSPAKRDAVLGPGGALEGMLEARERGLIGHVGFTSHSLDLALELGCVC
ncbi:MAG: aldo/keto reductase [Planctomycetota bacterium]|jgi:aryl-alcohol dehydrogenase-like predicted oxidoreductase